MSDLAKFAAKVRELLKKFGHTQTELALEVNLTYTEFNRRLNGNSKTPLNCYYVKEIIKALAKWKAFRVKSEVRELLDLMDCPDFDAVEWQFPPLVSIKDLSESEPMRQKANPIFSTSRACPAPPPAPEQFGGRDQELIDLKNRMKTGQPVALTAMRGLGGIGKTTLARQLASDLFNNTDEKLFQAVLWKEIKRKPEPLKLLLSWAYLADPAFLYKEQPPEQLAQQVKFMLENWIVESCGRGRTLVVFDDVWDDGIEAVRLLRQACPANSTVLITTRTGRIAALLSAQEISLDKLDPDRGVELLIEYLPDADPGALRKLAEVLGGHPLAMTIAAKRVRLEESYQQGQALLEHIAEYESGLPAGTSFAQLDLELGEEKEDNLTKALYFSYAELNSLEQGYFRKLGILPYNAPFNDGMLVAIWKLSPEQVKKPCKRLRLLSLLDSDEQLIKTRGGNWYHQHPLVQSYAKALLQQGMN